MDTEFDRWNKIKQQLEVSQELIRKFPKESEVWVGILGKNIGFEQNGSGNSFSRPLLVIHKFNNQMFWCVPLSTKQKQVDFYFNFSDPNKKTVSVILGQMRLISIKRLKRKLYTFEPETFNQIKLKLRSFL